MSDLEARVRAHLNRRRAIDAAVDAGTHTEKCFSCDQPATHRTTSVTPAGYKAYQCAKHAAQNATASLWGSDPGWASQYEPLAGA